MESSPRDRGVRLCRRRHAWKLLACLAAFTPADARQPASLSSSALLILGKSLSFMQPAIPAGGAVAVVYDANRAGSKADAEAIMTTIGSFLQAGGVRLRPSLVERSALDGADFQLVIAALSANGDAVMRASRSHHALCVTADVAAVTAGTCMMAIRSTGRVEIILNHEATQGAAIGFATAFRMMVQEL